MNTTKMPKAERERYWSNHIEQWKSSGLTRTAYCEQCEINIHQLGYWINKFTPEEPDKQPKNFIAVASPAASHPRSGSDFALQLPNGTSLQWNGQADPAYVLKLARGLAP